MTIIKYVNEGGIFMKIKLKEFFKDDQCIANMPYYRIYLKEGDGWYVINKLVGRYRRFGFENYNSFLDVLDYAINIG